MPKKHVVLPWIGPILRCGLIIVVSFSLQGCLLYYLLAPKTNVEHLPDFPTLTEQRQVYVQHCGRCHLLIDPVYFRDNAEIDQIVKRYLDKRVINQKEAQAVAFYIKTLVTAGVVQQSPAPP